MQFATLTSALVFAFALVANGSPTAETGGTSQTIEQFNEWLANTDADITYVGTPIDKRSGLDARSALNTVVTYCTQRSGNICGGSCTVYNGGSACLSTPNTQCLSATNNVAFCDGGSCGGSCNNFANCGTRLDGGFCYTPGTKSINVSNA